MDILSRTPSSTRTFSRLAVQGLQHNALLRPRPARFRPQPRLTLVISPSLLRFLSERFLHVSTPFYALYPPPGDLCLFLSLKDSHSSSTTLPKFPQASYMKLPHASPWRGHRRESAAFYRFYVFSVFLRTYLCFQFLTCLGAWNESGYSKIIFKIKGQIA